MFKTRYLFFIFSWLFISCGGQQPDHFSVRFGVCTDVHKDIMHDADERLAAFISEAKGRDLDFIIQINSMSYYWAGGDYQVNRYSEEINEQFPWIKYTIPYAEPLYAFVEINNEAISIKGKETSFVGPGPEELGMPPAPANNPIVPRISSRKLPLKP